MTKICIFGAGAIGGYIAASLAKTDSKISLIARGPHKKAIEEKAKKGKSKKNDNIFNNWRIVVSIIRTIFVLRI